MTMMIMMIMFLFRSLPSSFFSLLSWVFCYKKKLIKKNKWLKFSNWNCSAFLHTMHCCIIIWLICQQFSLLQTTTTTTTTTLSFHFWHLAAVKLPFLLIIIEIADALDLYFTYYAVSDMAAIIKMSLQIHFLFQLPFPSSLPSLLHSIAFSYY